MIKSEFLIMTGMVWLVSSDKMMESTLTCSPLPGLFPLYTPFTFLPYPLSLGPWLNGQTFVAYLPKWQSGKNVHVDLVCVIFITLHS